VLKQSKAWAMIAGKPRFVRYAVCGLVLSLLGPGAASGRERAHAKPASSAATKITFVTDFGVWGGNAGPLYAGIKEGIFEKYGIDLNVVPGVGSTDTAQKIAAGTAQFGLVDGVAGVLAQTKGADIKFIGSYLESHVGGLCYVQGRHPINSYKDMEGIHIGATAADAYMVFLPYLMKLNGATPNYHYDVMAIANTGPALLSGTIDATSCGVITLPSRLAAGEKVGEKVGFFPYGKHGLNALGLMLTTSSDLATKNPGLVQRFLRAYAESLQWSRAHPQQMVNDFPSEQTAQDPSVVLSSWQLTAPFQLSSPRGQLLSMLAQKAKSTVGLTLGAYNLGFTKKKVYALYQEIFDYKFLKKLPAALRKP
jgi:NitT/TauT family transport system substrate-binding protein